MRHKAVSGHLTKVEHSWNVVAKLGSWLFVTATTLLVAIQLGMVGSLFSFCSLWLLNAKGAYSSLLSVVLSDGGESH